ncbi:MAG: hypothetical protein O9317_01545, partial [Microcystis sp. LE19-59.1C]|nr:hypothetical protein [Microcystis sp. LE19-59.1C]
LKTERVPIIFINKYFTQFIPGRQEGYATTTESLLTLKLRSFWFLKERSPCYPSGQKVIYKISVKAMSEAVVTLLRQFKKLSVREISKFLALIQR